MVIVMTPLLCIVSAVKLALTTIRTGTDHPELIDIKLCLDLAYAAANTGVGHPECGLCFAESAKKPKSAFRICAHMVVLLAWQDDSALHMRIKDIA